jgi:hypothetical protein
MHIPKPGQAQHKTVTIVKTIPTVLFIQPPLGFWVPELSTNAGSNQPKTDRFTLQKNVGRAQVKTEMILFSIQQKTLRGL